VRIIFFFLITIYCVLNAAPLNPAYFNNSSNYFAQCQFDARIANNTFNLAQYYANFYHDIEWDYAQKSAVFNLLPDKGITLNADLAYNLLDFSSPLLCGSFQIRQLYYAYAPKDLFDLTLFGNDLNRLYTLSNFSYNYLKYYDVGFGFRYPLVNFENDGYDNLNWSLTKLNLGIKIHWLQGKSVTNTDSSFGSVYTTSNIFSGQVKLFESTARGGNNFSFDIGAMINFQPPLTLGLAILNLNTGFVWNNQPQQKLLEIEIDSFCLQRYVDAGSIDSFYRKTDSILSNWSFRTSLPVRIILETSYPIVHSTNETNLSDDILTIYASYQKYLSNNKLIIDYQSSFDVAFAWKLTDFFTTKHSFTTDFHKGYTINHSFTFFVKNFLADLSILQQNGYLTTAKGIGVDFILGYYW